MTDHERTQAEARATAARRTVDQCDRDMLQQRDMAAALLLNFAALDVHERSACAQALHAAQRRTDMLRRYALQALWHCAYCCDGTTVAIGAVLEVEMVQVICTDCGRVDTVASTDRFGSR